MKLSPAKKKEKKIRTYMGRWKPPPPLLSFGGGGPFVQFDLCICSFASLNKMDL